MRKKGRSEITAICRTKEEEFVMTVLIVYCQNAYRELKKEGRVKYFNQIVDRAMNNYQEVQGPISKAKYPKLVWY
ncbi:hypothetical protein ES703_79267 [subsurface metagenome]